MSSTDLPPAPRAIAVDALPADARATFITRTYVHLYGAHARSGTMMVEGFDAADPRLASAREIVAEWTEVSSAACNRVHSGGLWAVTGIPG